MTLKIFDSPPSLGGTIPELTSQVAKIPTPIRSAESLCLTPEYHVAEAIAPYVQPSGGDFHAAFPIPDGSGDVAVVLGDVSGHGPEISGQAQELRDAVSQHLAAGLPPAAALEKANASAEPNPDFHGFATVFAARLEAETGKITYASAGQEPGMIAAAASPREAIAELETTGPAVGIFPAGEARFEQQEAVLPERGTLLLHTDGATDVRLEGTEQERFGTNRLKGLLARLSGLPLSKLVTNLVSRIFAFCRGKLSDDLALLAVRRASGDHNDL